MTYAHRLWLMIARRTRHSVSLFLLVFCLSLLGIISSYFGNIVACYQRFVVSDIGYSSLRLLSLVIPRFFLGGDCWTRTSDLLRVAQFMGFLKGKNSLMIFDRHANLKYKYGSRNFWRRGYYVDTVGRNKKIIAEYIRNQLEEDYAADQIRIKEYVDPFTDDKNKKA